MNFRTTIQNELNSFFKNVDGAEHSIRKVTKRAFTQARSKIDPFFKRLNKVAADTFYSKSNYFKWHDFRLLDVDGSRVQLPNHKTVKDEWDHPSYKKSKTAGNIAFVWQGGHTC